MALDATVLLPARQARQDDDDAAAAVFVSATGLGGGSEGHGCGQGEGTGGLVRFLCLVHRVVDVSSASSVNSWRSSPGHGSRGALGSAAAIAADGTTDGLGGSSKGVATTFSRLLPLEGIRVDALFKEDTQRAVDVCPGSQLRIYDPCCVWRDVETEVEGGGGRGEGALLLCTQMCEPYPSCLPPLPAPPAAWATTGDG